jgi:hypothetical protein
MRPHNSPPTFWQRAKAFIIDPAFLIPSGLAIVLAAAGVFASFLSVHQKAPRYAVISALV